MSRSRLQEGLVVGAFALAAVSAAVAFGAKRAVAQSDERHELDTLPTFQPGVLSSEPILLARVHPIYPARALSRGDNGAVALRFTIAADGTTKDVEVVESSSQIFESPAIVALRQWRWRPHTENGGPVERRGVETVLRFQLNDRDALLPSERVRR